MKTSNVVKLSLVAVLIAFVSSVTGYLFGARADGNNRIKDNPGQAVAESNSPQNDAVIKETKQNVVVSSYLLRETEGTVALYYKYSDGKEKLYKTYDISVKSLPQSDRELLKNGIEVEALSDALQLIEDYM